MEQHPRLEIARLVLTLVALIGLALEVLTVTGLLDIDGPNGYPAWLLLITCVPLLLVVLSSTIWPPHSPDGHSTSK
jgi:hypothetical protein